jgi:1,4-alpha-glucan branching enzyme
MQAEENGYWYINIAEAQAGDQYRFLLSTPKGEFKRIDPYAREVTNSVGNAIIHDPSFDWQGDDFHLTAWNELVIYELHVGTFNDQESDNHPALFPSISARLGHLKKLGIMGLQMQGNPNRRNRPEKSHQKRIPTGREAYTNFKSGSQPPTCLLASR